MLVPCGISESFHLHHFQKLKLIHELIQWCSPSLTESLDVLSLFDVYLDGLESIELLKLLFSECLYETVSDLGLFVRDDDPIIHHSLQYEVHALL
jgi:hypothetical protein